MTPRHTADSDDMSPDGERVRARRERLGMDKLHLAEQAGVSRETLAAIEKGQGFRRSSLTKIEKVLRELEQEAGLPDIPQASEASRAPAPSITVVRLSIGEVVVEGPVENLAELQATVEALAEWARRNPTDS